MSPLLVKLQRRQNMTNTTVHSTKQYTATSQASVWNSSSLKVWWTVPPWFQMSSSRNKQSQKSHLWVWVTRKFLQKWWNPLTNLLKLPQVFNVWCWCFTPCFSQNWIYLTHQRQVQAHPRTKNTNRQTVLPDRTWRRIQNLDSVFTWGVKVTCR